MLMHSHKDFSELVIVTEGSARHIVDNESYVISKGDVFVISGDTEHGFSDAQDLRICNIMFEPSFWTKNSYDIKKTIEKEIKPLIKQECCCKFLESNWCKLNNFHNIIA